MSKTWGFAAGNKIAISELVNHEADYILLIYNDTIIKDRFFSVLGETIKILTR